mmetsp:Transcript_14116/g.31320  ORF Transcript_14116/g.31320 Transcript_14116/m.31320 type:complete len:282 (-) Transcript_14116:154-999(-)
MLISYSCNQVGQRHAPLHSLPELVKMALDHVQNGPRIVLGVAQEAKQVLRRSVASAPAQTHDGPVHDVGPFHDGVNAVGHPQLLVVVPVEADLHVGERGDVSPNQEADLLTVQTAKRICQIEVLTLAGLEFLQARINLGQRHLGNRHQIDGDLVPALQTQVGQLDGLINLMSVARHTHEVQQRILLHRDVAGVDAANVGHRRQLQAGLVVPNNSLQILRGAEAPWAHFPTLEILLTREVPNLHVVDPSLHASIVHSSHKIVCELPLVHQPPISDGTVNDLD